MDKRNFLDKLLDYHNGNIQSLTPLELKHKQRIDYIIELKIHDITISDKRIISLIRTKYNIKAPITILNDITIAERILSFGKNKRIDTDKYWIRYFISETLKEAIRIAREKGDSYAMIQGANTLGKHHLTDKEDDIAVAFDRIVPFLPEITTDITVLGLKPIENLETIKNSLLKKYSKEVEDINYEEINKEKVLSE